MCQLAKTRRQNCYVILASLYVVFLPLVMFALTVTAGKQILAIIAVAFMSCQHGSLPMRVCAELITQLGIKGDTGGGGRNMPIPVNTVIVVGHK